MPFLVLVLAFTAGCSKASPSDPAPFAFDRELIAKVTFYRGDGELVAELADDKELNELSKILDKARPFAGAYPFDLFNTIVVEWKDGNKRKLSVTGNGHVFVDESAKIAFQLDKQKFMDFVEELR
jgi:hypothetical protein